MFFVAERFFSVIWMLNDDNPGMSLWELIWNQDPSKLNRASSARRSERRRDSTSSSEEPRSSSPSSGSSAYTVDSRSSNTSLALSPREYDSQESPSIAASRIRAARHTEPLTTQSPPDICTAAPMELPSHPSAACSEAIPGSSAALRHSSKEAGDSPLSDPISFHAPAVYSGSSSSAEHPEDPLQHPASKAAADLGSALFVENMRSSVSLSNSDQQHQKQFQRAFEPGLVSRTRRVKRHMLSPFHEHMQQRPLEQQQDY